MPQWLLEILPVTVSGKLWRLPPSLNARVHWAERYKINKAFQESLYWQLKDAGIPKCQRINVTIQTFSCHPQDLDNIAASFKGIGDALIYAEVIPNDSPEYLRTLIIKSDKANSKKEERVLLMIEEIE